MATRRETLIGLGATATVAACSRAPSTQRDVVAAGQPAAVLIWSVARERLAGWPRRPDPECLAGLAAGAVDLPELGGLSGPGRKADPAALSALRPRLILDYGDTEQSVITRGREVSESLGVPWALIDGSLNRIPDAFRQAGRLLDDNARGQSLADDAEQLLQTWGRSKTGPSFYYAKNATGLQTGFRGSLSTEVLEGGGWTNVATGGEGVGSVTHAQIMDWDPEVLVTLNPDFAQAAQNSSDWRQRRDGSRRRLLLMPDQPFGWIDRPPSVNRLLGCAWLAQPNETAATRLALLSRRLYGMAPIEIRMPKWLI
ncbi:MAG: iron ABC transporter substrate-binding protein [Brevundimonas sp.]|nr:MAG: iron ABC transporter substrate-binding protein [Brevundimonas sp.]